MIGSVLVGASKEKHIDDAAKAIDLSLPKEEIAYLEELYIPYKVVGALDNPNR